MELDGSKIKELRKEAKIRRKELAERMEMTESGLFKIESGKTVVSVEHVSKLAEIFERPFSYVFDYLGGNLGNDYLKELTISQTRLTQVQEEKDREIERLRQENLSKDNLIKAQAEHIRTLKQMLDYLQKHN